MSIKIQGNANFQGNTILGLVRSIQWVLSGGFWKDNQAWEDVQNWQD